MTPIDSAALDTLFFNARTHNVWLDKEVPDALLKTLYETLRWGPTSANGSPLRISFIKSQEGKQKLKPTLDEGNMEKTMHAPVVALIAVDMEFYENLPKLFPAADARSWFAGQPEKINFAGHLNASLQGGYFILAARALGLDCGPMSGFDRTKADAAFFAGTPLKSLFLCNLGYGDRAKLHPRNPRLAFDEACKIL